MKNSGLGTCHSEGEHYLNINCARLDKEIGQLVYDLYGLTEEDIKIVDGN